MQKQVLKWIEYINIGVAYLIFCQILPSFFMEMWPNSGSQAGKMIVNQIITLIFTGMFLYGLYKRENRKCSIFKNITFKNMMLSLLCAVVLFFTMNKAIVPGLAALFPKTYQSFEAYSKKTYLEYMFQMPYLVLIAPVFEEILVRGYILQKNLEQEKTWKAIFISALFFGVLHFNLIQGIGAFIAGILFGILYVYTDSLFCCILMHVLYNGFTFYLQISAFFQ